MLFAHEDVTNPIADQFITTMKHARTLALWASPEHRRRRRRRCRS